MEHFDLIIVGSGPAGAAVAREFLQARGTARVLMVERGPQTTTVAGRSVRNLPDDDRVVAERASQGPNADGASVVSDSREARPVARPGTFLLHDYEGGDLQSGMPGALITAGVGGMGQHWTCACPTPGNTERVPFIPAQELDQLLVRAGELLHVTQEAYPETGVRSAVERALGEIFDEGRPASRRVQAMPLAATPTASGHPEWSGVDTVLGPLAPEDTRPDNFELRPLTLARRVLLREDGAVAGVELEDRQTGQRYEVESDLVTVAADAFGSPQLLWASGIRPRALGHYLNDQPQVMCMVYLNPEIAAAESVSERASSREAMTGVSWIPFWAPDYPFHGQIMQREAAPLVVEDVEKVDDLRPMVGLGCFTTKDLQFADHVAFSETETDWFGMPAPTVHYELTAVDRATIDRAITMVTGLAEKMGTPVPGGHPRLVPSGSSIHYQGSVRMGERPDGTSVCDPWGEVWDVPGLFLAGNGVIPTPTASNPTVTTVALAVRTARAMATRLR